MRVAINGLGLHERSTGVWRYTYHLLTALGRVDGVNEYLVLSPYDEQKTLPDPPSSFSIETAPVGGLGKGSEHLARVLFEQRIFPAAARRAGAKLLHVPYFAPPLRAGGVPLVVTIPDVLPMRWAQYRGAPTTQAYSMVTGRAAKRADAIIAYSEHARGEISALLDIPSDRVHVIPPAADTRFRPADAEAQEVVRRKYGLGERFILHVGGLDVRQNLELLIGAFMAVYNEIGDPDLSLFIAGDPQRLGSSALYPDWRPLAATFGISDRVQCDWIAEEDMPAVYSACSCFVFPSLYEGFGLTPLEAMSCGAPVVCSNVGSVAEAVGIAGVQVDPTDVDRVSAAIARVLNSRELANDLHLRGLTHVRRFAWDRVAAETSALYAEVMGTKRDY
jgi:glycosyltransferase involved in cell wall biosynthesis